MEETRKTKEIDVIGMIMKIIPKWKFIAKVVMVTAVIGVIVALSTPKEYTTNVISRSRHIPEGYDE